MNMNKRVLLISVVLFLLLFTLPTAPRAELADELDKFKPRIGIEEEYNDNLDLAPSNKRDDFITRVTPGLHYTQGDPTRNIDLDYQLGLVYYAREHGDNLISHNGTLGAQYAFTRQFMLKMRDYLVRSDEQRETSYRFGEEGQYLPMTGRERQTYTRNVFEPSLSYQFGQDNLFNLGYRNNIYRSEATGRDSTENAIVPSLSFQITPMHSFSFDYTHIRGTFDTDPNMTGDEITGRYSYRPSQQTTLSCQYLYIQRSFDQKNLDYDIHSPGIGIDHQFSAAMQGSAKVRYYRKSGESGDAQDGFSGKLEFSVRMERTTLNISAETGYKEDYFTSVNAGFIRHKRLSASISHQLQKRLSLSLSGGLMQSKEESGLKEKPWDVNVALSYQPLKWLTTSLHVIHSEASSNVESLNYEANKVIIRLTATY